MDKLRISILDIDMRNLDTQMNNLKQLGIKNIHIDIIDTSFGEIISFGTSTLNFILSLDFNFDIHFMIKNPELILRSLKIKDNTVITIHLTTDFCSIKKEFPNLKFGLALNPNQDIDSIIKYLPSINHVLVMSVNPGLGGQKFIDSVLNKIKELKKLNIFVGIDGGINGENIEKVREADFVVVGSYLTKSEDKMGERLQQMIEKLE